MLKTVSQVKNILRIDYVEHDNLYYIKTFPKSINRDSVVEVILTRSEFKSMIKDCATHLLQEI